MQSGGKLKIFSAALVAGTRDDEAATKIHLMPLFDDTMQRRNRECAANILDGIVRCLRSSQYSQFI